MLTQNEAIAEARASAALRAAMATG
jgi:hypothetical protein